MDPARVPRRPPSLTLAWSCGSTPGPLGPNPYPLHPLGLLHLSDPHHPAGACEPCPKSWLPFGSSCYYFSVPKTHVGRGARPLRRCQRTSVGDLEEQVCRRRGRSPKGAWLGGGAVREGAGLCRLRCLLLSRTS